LNKALLDTDILSEIIKGFDQTVAGNAKGYRRAFGHYVLDASITLKCVVTERDAAKARQLRDDFRDAVCELTAPGF
jgi:hypothetical protein